MRVLHFLHDKAIGRTTLRPGRLTSTRDATCFAKSKRKKYGSGRAQLGLDGIAPESISDRKEEDARPALKEYLEFGKAIGEDIEDVQRQLKINGTSVLMDNESRQFLEAWQAEEMAAYEMFEYMLQDPSQVGSGDEHPVGSLSSGSKSVLMRNKNRVQHGLGRLGTIRRKKSSLTSRKKLSATDSKLIRNKARYNDVTSFSGSTDAPEFELIASSPESDTDQTPTLNDPPKRSYASVMEGVDYTDDDDLWEHAEDSVVEAELDISKPLPPTYESFEAIMSITEEQKHAKETKRKEGDNVRINLKKPANVVDLQSKPKRVAPPENLEVNTGNTDSSIRNAHKKQTRHSIEPINDEQVSEERDPSKNVGKVEESAFSQPVQLFRKPDLPTKGKGKRKERRDHSASKDENKSRDMEIGAAEASPAAVQPLQKSPGNVARASQGGHEQQLHYSKPSSPPPLSKGMRTEMSSSTKINHSSRQRKARSLEAALKAQSEQKVLKALVWGNNSAGVLVQAGEITGFVPFSEFSPQTISDVLNVEKSLMQNESLKEEASPRRLALSSLVGCQLMLGVEHINEQSQRVILSERVAFRWMNRPPSSQQITPEILSAAQKAVGEVFTARVRTIRPFGCFLEFDIPIHDGRMVTVNGLCHISEFTWDAVADPSQVLSPGQSVQARLVFVNMAKGRLFLSIRRAEPNPLLETLDSLLGSAKVAFEGDKDSNIDRLLSNSTDTRSITPRQTADAAEDLRPFLGDLDVATEFAKEIAKENEVEKIILGRRLQSRAFSQDVQVFMSRMNDEDESKDSAARKVDLVIRSGHDVQIVEVITSLNRDELREIAVSVTQRLVEERNVSDR